MPSFHASGTSFGASVSSISRRSRSKRRMMWRLYVVSSASTRISAGLGAVDRGHEASRSTLAELVREGLLQRLVPVRPERAAARRRGSPTSGSATRSSPSDGALASGVRSSEGRDAVRVEAVPRLVHRRPERVEPRRLCTASSAARPGVENEVQKGCTVGSSRHEPFSKPTVASTRSPNARCSSAANGTSRNDASTCGASRTSSGEHGPDRVEDLRDLGRRHERLEVVEQRRVRRVVPLEALGVALLQLEVPLERRGGRRRSRCSRARRPRSGVPARRPAASRCGARWARAAPSPSRDA